jgi:hypothetical protein
MGKLKAYAVVAVIALIAVAIAQRVDALGDLVYGPE